jgi:cytochrome c oxidase cbb3-type subunit 3
VRFSIGFGALLFLFCGFLLLTGCDWMPGKPADSDRWKAPGTVTDFKTLYSQNCLACHGDGETVSASKSMNDPLYLAFIPRETMRSIVAKGIPGTGMPAFAVAEGGALNDAQIDSIINGIHAWATSASAAATTESLPPYSAPLGDAVRGQAASLTYCASCHGPDGTGNPPQGHSIVDPAYLALVSDQYLRTVIVTGRPDLGMPDFRSHVPGHAMSPEDVSNVVAWLASQRPVRGQPTDPRKP